MTDRFVASIGIQLPSAERIAMFYPSMIARLINKERLITVCFIKIDPRWDTIGEDCLTLNNVRTQSGNQEQLAKWNKAIVVSFQHRTRRFRQSQG